MRSRFLITALALFAAPAAAQMICEQFNPGMASSFLLGSIGPTWALGRFKATAYTNVTGMELKVYANSNAAAVGMGIWSVDPVTGQPGALLAWGTAEVHREWRPYSAALHPAVNLTAGMDFFIGCRIGPGAAVVPVSITGVTGDIFTGTGGSWFAYYNAPLALEFNLYCGSHSGSSSRYGAGKIGAGGFTPKICLQGFPNLGNTIAVQVADTAAATLGGVVIGDAVPPGITLPIGTLYVFPVITTVAAMTSANLPGYVTWQIPIPNNPSLPGTTFACEGWVLDGAAVGGLSHSDAVEFTIGN